MAANTNISQIGKTILKKYIALIGDISDLIEEDRSEVADLVRDSLLGFSSESRKNSKNPLHKDQPKAVHTIKAQSLGSYLPFKKLSNRYNRLLVSYGVRRAIDLKDREPEKFRQLLALGKQRSIAYENWKSEKMAKGLIRPN